WNEARRVRARAYGELLARGAVAAPHVPEWSRPVFHLFVVRVADRERVMRELDAAGIGTGIHYPHPLHLSAPYAHLGYRGGDLPAAERAAAEVLSLPMFPNLSAAAQTRVVAELLRVVEAGDAVAPVV